MSEFTGMPQPPDITKLHFNDARRSFDLIATNPSYETEFDHENWQISYVALALETGYAVSGVLEKRGVGFKYLARITEDDACFVVIDDIEDGYTELKARGMDLGADQSPLQVFSDQAIEISDKFSKVLINIPETLRSFKEMAGNLTDKRNFDLETRLDELATIIISTMEGRLIVRELNQRRLGNLAVKEGVAIIPEILPYSCLATLQLELLRNWETLYRAFEAEEQWQVVEKLKQDHGFDDMTANRLRDLRNRICHPDAGNLAQNDVEQGLVALSKVIATLRLKQ